MASGCRTFFRIVLGILTALFLIIGLFMLGFGIGLKVDPNGVFNMVAKISESAGNDMVRIVGGITDGAAIFMIVLGCITTVISFIGFAGAVSGSICLLVTYAIVMFLILGAEIALIIVVAAFPNNLAGKVSPLTNYTKEDAYITDRQYVLPPNDENGRGWYFTQNFFDCCGIFNSDDYKSPEVKSKKANGNYTISRDLTYPISCCKKKQHSAFINNTNDLINFNGCVSGDKDTYNEDGCVKKMLASAGPIPIAIAATTLGIEVLLIICSIIIACLKDDSVL